MEIKDSKNTWTVILNVVIVIANALLSWLA